MLYYGIELAAGTNITNLVCEGGGTLPATNLSAGRLFYLTADSKLYMYTGSAWTPITGSSGGGGGGGGVTSFNTRTGAVTLIAADLVGLINATNLPVASSSTLGAVKIGSGVTVAADGTISVVSSGGGGGGGGTDIPSGSKMLFAQPAAPTGWTQVTDDSANNRMLRVVNSVNGSTGAGGTGGGGYAGSDDPTFNNKVPSHSHTATTTVTDPGHTHTATSTVTDPGHHHSEGLHLFTSSGQAASSNPNFVNYQNTGTSTTGITVSTSVNPGTSGISASTTVNANGGGSNWVPRYLSLILCTKN